ncbi:YvaD family protein [Archangium gephyra]|uniref:DUF5360 family protein n=1 Tax=Archangium gephyra TaxID=48 RepID=UPI0035D42A62
MKRMDSCFLGVAVGFLAYWAVTLLHLLPEAYLFKDYHDPAIAAWNWSFLPLDLFICAAGLSSFWLRRRGHRLASQAALVMLTLSFSSGLQAIAFWVVRRDFDWAWWTPNLFLLLYPLFFLRAACLGGDEPRRAPRDRREVPPPPRA